MIAEVGENQRAIMLYSPWLESQYRHRPSSTDEFDALKYARMALAVQHYEENDYGDRTPKILV